MNRKSTTLRSQWRLLLSAFATIALTGATSPSLRAQSWPTPAARSGVNGDPAIDRASVEAFGNWRGRPATIALVYTDRTSWESMTRGSGWLLHNFRGYPGQLVISQGLLPNGARADLAGCAAGSFDHYFRDFGALLANSTRSDTVIRLGWEFNGEMFSWAATNTQQWIQCYRHAALAIRAANPFAVFDWAINAHGTPAHICSGDSRNCYPGDDVVDIIGIDNYDHGPSATSQAEFDRIANAREGLTWQYNFAMSRGKRFSVAEWGIAPKSPYNTTGENPMFIFWMYKWFRAHSANLAYEAYFNHCHDLGTNLFRSAAGCVTNVEAGNMYKMLFRDPAVLPWPDPREF